MALAVSSLLAVVALAGLFGGLLLPLPAWLLWLVAVPAAAVALNELLGKPVPFLTIDEIKGDVTAPFIESTARGVSYGKAR